MINQNEPEKIKVSIILPVWNPGPGISCCIESLRNQTLSDIEIIFVDDLGTDYSMEKVRMAAAEDSRIQIIENKKNIGPGLSRNKGIEAARGEYLSFVDPDDYVAPDFLELLYSDGHKNQADIVKGCSILVREDGSVVSERSTANKSIKKKLSTGTPLYCAFTRGHHNAIYRTDFILSQNVRYGVARRFEDVLFLLEACYFAKEFITNDDAHYYYCERATSLTNTAGQESINYYFEGIYELQDYCEKILPGNRYIAEYLRDLFHLTILHLYRYKEMGTEDAILKKHLNGFHDAVSNSSYRETLTKNSFTLRVWYEYKRLLPLKLLHSAWDNKNPPMQYAKLVEHWIDYYLATPGEAEACWEELKDIIIRVDKTINGNSRAKYSANEQEEWKTLLKKQIKRLPPHLRLKLNTLSTKEKARYIAARVLPKPIKRMIKTMIYKTRQQQ